MSRPMDGVELVLFDLDGTLIDSVPSLAMAIDRMLCDLGRPAAGEAKVRQWVGNGAPMLVARALSGAREVDENLNPELQQQALERFLEAYADCADQAAHCYPGVIETLSSLQRRGVRMALVTNKPVRFLSSLLHAQGLDGFFELLIGGDSLAQKKPHPLPLQHCMEQLGCDPQRTLMIGDSAADIEAARAAGVQVVGVSYGYSYPQPVAAYRPDRLVDSLRALL